MALRWLVAAFMASAMVLCAQNDSDRSDDDSLDASGVRIGRRGASVQLGMLIPTKLQMLRIAGGYSTPSVSSAPSYSPLLAMELDFGSLAARRLRHDSSVARLDGSSIVVAALSPSVAFRDESRVAVEGWRIGFRLVSGHRLASQAGGGLYLLHSGGWTWSFVRAGNTPSSGDSAANAQAIATAEAYRSSHFGANTSATIGYSIGGVLMFEASYQRVLLYKNHVFFPWLGSLLLEGIAQTALGAALSGAEQRNASAAALAELVLRSALSWGIYQLRSTSGQHFPFRGNTPMLWDEFRVGIGVQF
jgi:hypothetical protein